MAATTVTFNGSTYSVPSYGDTGWAQGSGNLSLYLVAIASGTLQTTGGTFTLSADVNFGASFGLLVAYISSRVALPATAGLVRLAKTDTIQWKNNAGGGNLPLAINGSDQLTYNGAIVVTSSVGPTPIQHRSTYTAGTPSGSYSGSLTLVGLPAAYIANGVNLQVFVNGLLNAPTLDYAETSTTSFTFNSPLVSGDRIDAVWTAF